MRSSHPEVFCKEGVPRYLTKFTGKHLWQSLFFNKVAGLRPATFLKKRLWHRCFPVDSVTFLRIPFYTEHLWWLLLIFVFIINWTIIRIHVHLLLMGTYQLFTVKRREKLKYLPYYIKHSQNSSATKTSLNGILVFSKILKPNLHNYTQLW